ncbi:hypothetical protein IAU59_002819 [Kwoniella sp. CBS 9459]
MSTPGNTSSPAPQNLGYPFIVNANPQAAGMNYLQNQQQFIPGMDMSSTSSPIPGASGGQGDPGPSSMAQAQQQQQGQFRPPFQQPGGMNPQQMAMLQQFSQAAQAQAQGQPVQTRQFTPQQIQMAMASMQQQQGGGGNVNPQALMAAMRANQQQQQQQQQGLQPGQGQMPQQPQQSQQRPPNASTPGYPNMPLGAAGNPGQQHPNPAQLAFQQQRIQQLMHQQGMQARPPGSPNRQGQQQQSQSQQQSGSMAPPPIPGTPQHQQAVSFSPNQMQPSNIPQQQPMGVPHNIQLTQQQQQMMVNQRNSLLTNPQFLAMPPQQQQAFMANQQQHFMRMVAVQTGQMPAPGQQQMQSQQQQQQQQQQMSSAQTPGRPTSSHGTPGPSQSPQIARQPTPQQMGTPQQVHTPLSVQHQTPHQPLSSLPQHMAPQRPPSAASQRAPSPHQGGPGMPSSPAGMPVINTPPPNSAMFPSSGPHTVNAPSPTPSNQSHHSQHHTPAPTGVAQPHSASPGHARSQTPNQMHQLSTPQSGQPVHQVGINGQPVGPIQSYQLQQGTSTPQQVSQSSPHMYPGAANQPGTSNAGPIPQPGFPIQPMMPNLQNMTPQQQQQMASAMSFMSQAAQAQNAGTPGSSQQQSVRPTPAPQPAARPPAGLTMPNINTSDFPFDPRLLPHIQHLNTPAWRSNMQAQNPSFLNAVQSASAVLPTLRPDVVQRMQTVLFHTARIQAAQNAAIRPPPGQPSPQQALQPGMPGFSPTSQSQGQASTPGPVPPNQQQQRMWQGQQPGQGSPMSASMSSPAIRPPPPHLPPAADQSGSPSPRQAHIGRKSSGRKEKGGTDKTQPQTPAQASMPPPSFIPSHVGPVRPPPHATPDSPAPSRPSAPTHAPVPVRPSTVSSNAVPVKEWENALRLNLPITKITPLPVDDIEEAEDPTFNGQLPALSEYEKIQIKGWLDKDKNFAVNDRSNQSKKFERMKKWAEENDRETQWWMLRKGEPRVMPSQRLRILWPADKDKDRAQRTHRGRKQIKFSQAALKSMAEVEDHLVPVRLEIEHEQHKLKDTFMWNCADKVVTPEVFAQTLCDDFAVPQQHFVPKIVAAIQERIHEYQDQVLPIVQRKTTEDNRGKLDPEGNDTSRAMVEVFRKVREGSGPEEEIKTDPGEDRGDDDVKIVMFGGEGLSLDLDQRPMTVEEAMDCLPQEETEELRILIKVDIIIGTQNLSDSFEWDLNSSVTPEEFATSYVTELGLSLEFATALAHDIHEQILVHKRSLFLVGHSFGSGLILDDEIRLAFLPPVTTSLRKEDLAMTSYTPIFNDLREDQLALLESQREKEAKRKKRAGRARRGITLPDREPIKTHRTLLNPLAQNGLPVFSAPEAIVMKDVLPTSRRRGAAIAAEASMALINQNDPPSSPAHHHHHGPTISARGKRIGRPPKNLSRASPASFREGSVTNGDHLFTPSMHTAGIKRSFREDSIDDLSAVALGSLAPSPAPSRKRASHSRIPDSPELDSPATTKMDLGSSSYLPPVVEVSEKKRRMDGDAGDVKMEGESKDSGEWRCTNCGVPEHLADSVRKDKKGQKSLCGSCSRYLVRTGKPRPCDYTEDEDVHRQRIEMGRRSSNSLSRQRSLSQSRATSPNARTPSSTASPIKLPNQISNNAGARAGTGSGSDSSSSEDGDDDDDDDDSDSTFASSARGRSKKRGRGRISSNSHTANHVMPAAETPAPALARSSVAPASKLPMLNVSPSSAKKPVVEAPPWAQAALAEMRAKYPRDDFVVIQKPRPAEMHDAPIEWRAKCMDCPGRIYSLGPGETLLNFEVHLKNRAHIANRLTREGKTH